MGKPRFLIWLETRLFDQQIKILSLQVSKPGVIIGWWICIRNKGRIGLGDRKLCLDRLVHFGLFHQCLKDTWKEDRERSRPVFGEWQLCPLCDKEELHPSPGHSDHKGLTSMWQGGRDLIQAYKHLDWRPRYPGLRCRSQFVYLGLMWFSTSRSGPWKGHYWLRKPWVPDNNGSRCSTIRL